MVAVMSEKLVHVLQDTTEAVRLRARDLGAYIQRAVLHTGHIKQFHAAERNLRAVLEPLIRRQGNAIANRLFKVPKESRSSAHEMIRAAFDPDKATKEIVDEVLPVLAYQMAKVVQDELAHVGSHVGVRASEVAMPKRVRERLSIKASTATEWLASQDDLASLFEDMPEFIEGSMPYRIVTEMPPQMKRMIAGKLRESFEQDYWRDISLTTQGDAEKILDQGLRDGWSIRRMANEMRESLGGDQYARTRSFNIARTESGGALNAARKGTIDQLQEDLGPQVPMAAVWLSVLSDTTREEHAMLDNVPADENGLWNLAGYMVSYPAQSNLPAGQRCNCMCSIFTELGMDREEAGRLIDQYYERQGE